MEFKRTFLSSEAREDGRRLVGKQDVDGGFCNGLMCVGTRGFSSIGWSWILAWCSKNDDNQELRSENIGREGYNV
jgi:hypothetical protein